MSTKIQFSQQEKDLVEATDWILTKQQVTQKIYSLFGEFYNFQKEQIIKDPFFSSTLFTGSGKIYKGENYLGLPYVILDHPCIFKKDNLFVVRTMFWWGNFISITLHVSGVHQSIIVNNKELLKFLKRTNFFICINADQWQHHFENDNYISVNEFSLNEFEKITRGDFFKISKKIPVAQAEDAYDFLVNSFKEIAELIKH